MLIFMYLKGKEREEPSAGSLPSACNSQGWARSKKPGGSRDLDLRHHLLPPEVYVRRKPGGSRSEK